jgi:hypothetical protein
MTLTKQERTALLRLIREKVGYVQMLADDSRDGLTEESAKFTADADAYIAVLRSVQKKLRA